MKRCVGTSGRGFTLIEALAAIAVMMILIPVLLEGFAIADQIALSTEQTADATSLAQSRLEELIATQGWQGGAVSGEEKINATDFQWEAVLNNFDTEQNVQTLTVTVHWQRRNQPRALALVTLVYLPGSTVSTTATPRLGGLP
jgi:type II secretory pathway pseudopilin PulG